MYNDKKRLGIREAVTALECDFDINDVTIDFSNDSNSRNTPKTTASPDAYNGDTQTYIFSDQQLKIGVNHFPLIDAKSPPTVTAAVLKPGVDIATSATASVTFSDMITDDVIELPYPYDKNRITGSFWAKFLETNFIHNRDCRLMNGYDPMQYDANNFQTENYVIKSTSGLNKGKVTWSLIDRLFFTTETKAKCPITTDAKLTSAILDATSPYNANFSGTSFGDKGIGQTIANGDTGIIAIGDELLEYTVTAYANETGTLSLVRGFGNTQPSGHEIDDSIQGCFFTQSTPGTFGAENITDITRRLVNNFTKIGSGFINDVKWDELKTGNLATFNFTNAVSKPESVRNLIKEQIQTSKAWSYFDVILNELIIGAAARFDAPVLRITEDEHILQDSLTYAPVDSLHVTTASIRYGRYLLNDDDDKNYTKVFRKIDGIAESEREYDQSSESKQLKTNWLTSSTTDQLIASSVVQLDVERNSEIPIKFNFKLDSRHVGDLENGNRLWYGSAVEIVTKNILDSTNGMQPKINNAQIVSLKRSKVDTWDVSAISYKANIPANVDLYIDADQVDYMLSDHLTTDEAREYVVVVNAGVRITASSTSAFAFDQGAFFAGATLKLIVLGYIVGAGGNGGRGASYYIIGGVPDYDFPATNGSSGGDAVNFTTNFVLDCLTGLVGSGAGGGAGGEVYFTAPDIGYGGGGGGGAGDETSTGGDVLGDQTPPGQEGQDGSFDFPGLGHESGGNGGELGEDGEDSLDATGGAAGIAITTNGNISDIAGFGNIKGAIV